MAIAQALRLRLKSEWTQRVRGPRDGVVALIIIGTLIRLIFAATTGLGVDESYMVATGRHVALSTYDPPPMAWWIARLASTIAGSESAFIVRLPFIALFAITTWQMYRLGERLFSARAGLFAALVLNGAPVLGVTTATWALPDGPLILALVSGSICLARVLFDKDASPAWWIAAGIWGGLAMLSKYHGVFFFAGTGLFVLTSRQHRRWLASPWPYAGALLAVIIFAPVVIWNAQHDWASFGFQSGRAATTHVRLWMPLVALAGQALFLFPVFWFAIVRSALRGLRRGPADERRWLLICLGIGPVVLFTMISAWSQSLFFHWAAPGYLMWIPLLGADLAEGEWDARAGWRQALNVSMAFVVAVVLAVSALCVAPIPWTALGVKDPLTDLRDWPQLRGILQERGLLDRRGTFIAGVRWYEAGRIDYALGGAAQVTCLCADARGYSVLEPPALHLGQDAVILLNRDTAPRFLPMLEAHFASLQRLDDVVIRHKTDVAADFAVYLGTDLKQADFR